MTRTIKCDVCVIGAGSAGLSVASGAAQLGARTILFEKGEMGGDCLNYGCVPSKALLAAAHAAQAAREMEQFGIRVSQPDIDFHAVMKHMSDVIGAIAPHDSVERFEKLGVRVIRAQAQFTGPNELSGGDVRVRARRIVIAAGSSAVLPSIPGIEDVPVLTNETIFSLDERPDHLLIIGGGPIGVEMAQAFRRLGSKVTLFQSSRLLPRDEPVFVDILRERLHAEGVEIVEHAQIAGIRRFDGTIRVTLDGTGWETAGSHLLVAAGRRPRLEGLQLDKAGVAYSPQGITVDSRLRTTNRRVYALGDVIGRPQFTHTAGYQAGMVIRNALFRLPAKVDYRALPWVTYSDPELAHVGLTEAEAHTKFGASVRTVSADFADNDRAQTERQTSGGIRVVVDINGTILGTTILGRNAGELIGLWGLAITQRLKLSALTGVIFPYPTLGEISKAAASAFYVPRLFSAWPRRLVRLLLWAT
ncbi:MAG: FAD-dependent oxidoreductase [Alphaproteobacteria bacterium]|nr:FAD-dependent oxidoreductase [Alphaproteobacteria bacterium]